MNIKKLIRRLAGLPALGQVLHGCPGPCPDRVIAPFDRPVDLAAAAKTARTQLCAEVCYRAGQTCGETVAGAAYEGSPLAPTTVPC
ncbi:MAG: hypothetical protein HOO96_02160, partial [Polyangiaceae bacterium]|nr:hypothetical protein [Polyangiaceae bacterium]